VKQIALTFDGLVRRTPFIALMDRMLATLDQAYGQPLDTEFTARVTEEGRVRINLLQCRALRLPGGGARVELPADVKENDTLFTSTQFMNAGKVEGVRYVLYVDAEAYASADMDSRRQLGRLIGQLNGLEQIIRGGLILIGPGRWGSSNILLGINVGYADISHAAVLVEVGSEKTGHTPELSFGTHFFQDLVESDILYVAVYPGQTGSFINKDFFQRSPNALNGLLPGAEAYAGLLRLIDLPAATGGLKAAVAADTLARKALCYLA
jgi:hypothetical protein